MYLDQAACIARDKQSAVVSGAVEVSDRLLAMAANDLHKDLLPGSSDAYDPIGAGACLCDHILAVSLTHSREARVDGCAAIDSAPVGGWAAMDEQYFKPFFRIKKLDEPGGISPTGFTAENVIEKPDKSADLIRGVERRGSLNENLRGPE